MSESAQPEAPEIPTRLVRDPEVFEITGIPAGTRWEKIAKGEFPKPVHIGPQARAWVYSELVEWVEAKKAERDHVESRTDEMRRRRVEGHAAAQLKREAAASEG